MLNKIKSESGLGDERGAALVIAMLMMIVLTLLGFTSMMYSTIDLTVAGNERVSLEAQYAAEAGINHGIAFINADPSPLPVAPYTPGPFATMPTETIGGYQYDVTIGYVPGDPLIDATSPVKLYNLNYYPNSTKAPATGGYPVVVITSTATNTTTGSSAEVELEVTKNIIPFDKKIKGALTANGSVNAGGNSTIDGNDYLDDGSAISGTGSPLPGISARGDVDDTGSSAIAGVGTDGTFSEYTSDPLLKSIADVLGMTEEEFNSGFLTRDYVNKYEYLDDSPPRWLNNVEPPNESLDGEVYYVRMDGALTWGPKLVGNGLLIVHNPLYSPESWRVSTVDRDITSPYYRDYLDPLSPNYDTDPVTGDTGYADKCKAAVLGNVNAQSAFTGVIICDKVDAFLGGSEFVGAIISLDDSVVDPDSLNGGATIKYSSAAVSRYGNGIMPFDMKLSWKKKSGYQN